MLIQEVEHLTFEINQIKKFTHNIFFLHCMKNNLSFPFNMQNPPKDHQKLTSHPSSTLC